MKKVGVILSGCGVFDGAEINESVLTLLALARAGAQVTCIAPDQMQREVINHATGEPTTDSRRNVREEAARIARGPVVDLNSVQATDFDALLFPGGFGAAKNLSNFAVAGADFQVDPAVAKLIQAAHAAKIPQAFMCIAPVLAAGALGAHGVSLTIGNDAEVAAAIQAQGAVHIDCPVDEIVIDPEHLIISTPAYMQAESILQAEAGINKAIAATLELA